MTQQIQFMISWYIIQVNNNMIKLQIFEFIHTYALFTHWGRVANICVNKLTIIASDNGLSSGRRQAIIWTNDGILVIWPLGMNFSEILSEIHTFSFKKMHFKTSSAKWRPFCIDLNRLRHSCISTQGTIASRASVSDRHAIMHYNNAIMLFLTMTFCRLASTDMIESIPTTN